MIRIRDARDDDARFLAWAVLAAGRSHVATSFWDLFLGRPADTEVERFLARLVDGPWRSWWHRAHFLVAEVDGAPAAALAGFAPDDPATVSPQESLAAAAEAHGIAGAAFGDAIQRALPFLGCTIEPQPGAWLVENVATRPEHRGRGLAARLVDAALARGRERGHGVAQLTLFLGNAPAQRTYERAGFTITEERRSADFERAIGCPGLARMQRSLGPASR